MSSTSNGQGQKHALNHRVEQTLELFEGWDVRSLLDLGCDDGELTARLGAASGADELYGVDLAGEPLAACRNRGVEAVQLDLDRQDLPFRDGQFDVCHAGALLDYLSTPVRFLQEVHRVLEPTGTFVASVLNLASLHNRLALLVGQTPFPLRASSDYCADATAVQAGRSSVLPTQRWLNLFEAAGFSVDAVRPCRAYRKGLSLPLRLADAIAARSPQFAYRVLLVARKRPEGTRTRVDGDVGRTGVSKT